MNKVLIVDDEPWTRDLYALALKKSDYEVFEARGAQEALYMVDDHSPHLIILDFFMPLNNALSVVYELQGHFDLAKIPIIILSSTNINMHSRNMQELNIVKVLNKCETGPLDLVGVVDVFFNEKTKPSLQNLNGKKAKVGGASNVDKK